MRKTIFTILSLTLGCSSDFNPDLGDLDDGTSEDGGADDGTSDDGGADDGSSTETDGTDSDEPTTGDTTGKPPETCGDGTADPGEECDGFDLRGLGCADLEGPNMQNFSGGALGCTEDCTYDTTACQWCGDETINGTEECDGPDLDNRTCEGEGFDGGVLGCDDECSLDLTACENCEGDRDGMYGEAGDCGAEAGGIQGGYEGKIYSVCLPWCINMECEDPALAICTAQPTCSVGSCWLLCTGNEDCPSGMDCVSLDGKFLCAWEI